MKARRERSAGVEERGMRTRVLQEPGSSWWPSAATAHKGRSQTACGITSNSRHRPYSRRSSLRNASSPKNHGAAPSEFRCSIRERRRPARLILDDCRDCCRSIAHPRHQQIAPRHASTDLLLPPTPNSLPERIRRSGSPPKCHLLELAHHSLERLTDKPSPIESRPQISPIQQLRPGRRRR